MNKIILNKTIPTYIIRVILVLILLTVSIPTVKTANAAQGDQLGTLDTPMHCSSGIGVSVAFDGTYFYYSCYGDPNLYKVRPPLGSVMRANPTTPVRGTLVDTLNTGLPNGLGAMAWDPGRRMIWAGTLYTNRGIYLVDPDTGTVTFKFQTPPVPIGFTDGLAYDGSDDTLWFSDDVSNTIYHFKTDGTVINSFSASFPSSGLAVGGTTLYAGSNGWGRIYKLDKSNGQVLGIFASPGGRDEDMECDDVTFSGVNALWSKDAYNNLVYAFEIPAGSCNTGGTGRNLVKVPDYKQIDPLWKPEPYDWELINGEKVSREKTWTVGGYGCFITSAVNIIRYWDVTTANDKNKSDVNPKTLNDYLSSEYFDKDGNPAGYPNTYASLYGIQSFSGGKIAYQSLSWVGKTKEQVIDAQLANNQPVMVSVPFRGALLYKDLKPEYQDDLNQGTLSQAFRDEFGKQTLTKETLTLSTNDKLLIWKIANNRWWIHDTGQDNGNRGYIATLTNNLININRGNKNGHWVVIVGPTVNGHYQIHDPGGYQGTDLGSYGDVDGIGKMYIWKPANGYQPQQRILAHSPVELLVTDPLGRRIGYDPDTQMFFNEIPDAIYEINYPLVNQDEEEGPNGEPEKVLTLPQPELGEYTLKVKGIGVGPYQLDFQTIDAEGNLSSQSVGGTASVGSVTEYSYNYDGQIINLSIPNQPPSIIVPGEQSVQYSDPLSFDVTATDPDDTNDTLTFSATGLPNNLSITANGDGTATVSGVANVAPGTYTAEITVTDLDGLSDTKNVDIVVINEDARTTYTGPLMVSTGCESCSTAAVPLRATIQDITAILGNSAYDPDAGNITNATVSFVDRNNGDAELCSSNVNLLDQSDQTVGTAFCDWTADLGNSSGNDYVVGIVVDGYYIRNSSDEDTVVVVSKPTSNFITGGGYFINQNLRGSYFGDQELKTNFGLTIKFNKKLTNLQGHVTIIVRQDGHVYQIKSNALSSLVSVPYNPAKPKTGTAELIGKANVTDVTDPLNPIVFEGNATLNVVMKDNGEPGNADLISISLWSKDGELLFSSNWDGTKTIKQLLGGGNLSIK